MNIREATSDDLEVIQDLNNKLCSKEYNEFDLTVNPDFATTKGGEKYFRKSIESKDSLVLLAEEDTKPIGYILGSIEEMNTFRTISRMCEIDNMWVDEAYRSKGVGKHMMDKIEVWAKQKGITRMRVIASAQNEKGIAFYTREGFKDYDVILEKDV